MIKQKSNALYRIGAAGLLLLASALLPVAQASELLSLLNSYTQSGATPFSAQRGKALWMSKHVVDPGKPERSCTTCHGADLSRTGKQVRTGKLIQPMATSVNPERLTRRKKMEKWLHRNCKWVLDRTCSIQEKGDILTFINTYQF